MARVYNFSAGPAVLPEEVLGECADEMLDYAGCGMSVMEMSHRSSVFKGIIAGAEARLRRIKKFTVQGKKSLTNEDSFGRINKLSERLAKAGARAERTSKKVGKSA